MEWDKKPLLDVLLAIEKHFPGAKDTTVDNVTIEQAVQAFRRDLRKELLNETDLATAWMTPRYSYQTADGDDDILVWDDSRPNYPMMSFAWKDPNLGRRR